MSRILLVSILFFSLTTLVKTKPVNQKIVVQRHNYYRKMVGVPDLNYSKECADYAQQWANILAKRNTGLKHSNTNKYGENIYWNSGEASEKMMVDHWAKEKKYFNSKSRTHTHENGHYSQVVWRKTKLIGVGMAIANDGSEYWVAAYYPAGNYIGEKVY